MQKKSLYIKNTGKYSRTRHGRKSRIQRIIKGAAGLVLVAVLGCSTIVYAVADDSMDGISANTVSDNEENEKEESISANAIDEVSANDCKELPADIVIVLDPGHGGEDEGCSWNGVLEKDVNLQIAKAVQTKLNEKGYQVVLTRETDQAYTTEERVHLANSLNADIYVSIHQNSCETAEPQGMEVWYSENGKGEESERLAKLIQKYTGQSCDANMREISETDSLYVIRESKMPSCLVETGFLSNPAERRNLTDPEYQEQIAEGIVQGIDLYFYPKTMYLTFDDGPSVENTNAVLDILKERNIKATFFVVGENVEKHPEVAKRIVEEGHTIGIHCYRHDYEELYASADSYIEDFEKAYNIVYEVTGVEVKLFRFPGGSINSYNKKVNEEIIRQMTEKGYIYFDWNASLEDAVTHAEPQVLIENATSSTLGRKKVVMLAHDIVYPTTQCLDELIDAFPEYRMDPLSEDVSPIQF
ncbi:MAG: N-acetylmuramoyl-L-alanine amidase [Lachnospiraceae bacterium]|nr:N-acetylmuramoyl-L-alanine amidase [Lachnospiraceae bacterium]